MHIKEYWVRALQREPFRRTRSYLHRAASCEWIKQMKHRWLEPPPPYPRFVPAAAFANAGPAGREQALPRDDESHRTPAADRPDEPTGKEEIVS
jgi:hypothetical protein